MQTDFQNYAIKHLGISSLSLDNWQKQQEHFVKNAVTPNIVEERKLNIALLSVFDRLMVDRIIWCAGPVDERMAIIVQAQLMYLDSLDKKDITLHIDSGGGSVGSGLSLLDVMNYIKSDIVTVNTGMCASMASVLLSSGTKGKRSSLMYSKVMTHMVSHGTRGNIQDTRINQMEAEKTNYILFKILAENCGKTFDEIFEISRKDKWFNSDEALKFGLIDEIIGVTKGNTITDKLKGFDEYYKKEVLGK
jgi:ATP-dependent Clp protease protease subunit